MADDRTSLCLDTVLCPAEGLDFVLISDDELLVQFGTSSRPSELFRDNDLSGVIGTLIRELQSGPASLRQLLSRVPEKSHADARTLIESLAEQGVISDAARDPVQQYIRYTFAGDSNMSASRVAIVGAGPIAARVARNLLQQGVARILLTDCRVTDPLWHSSIPFGSARADDTGQPVQAVLADYLHQAGHPNVDHLDWADGAAIEQATADSDLVILALEQPDLQLAHAVNRSCIRAVRPWLAIVIDGNLGLIGPQFQPPDTACYNDFQLLVRAATPNGAMARKHRQHLLANGGASFFPGLPAYADVAAGHGSIAAAHFLIRGTNHLLGRVMIVDFDGMRIDVEDVLKLPRCPVCATRRASYRPPFPEQAETAV